MDTEIECPVCKENYEDNGLSMHGKCNTSLKTDCKHYICSNCCLQLYRTRNTLCPICRDDWREFLSNNYENHLIDTYFDDDSDIFNTHEFMRDRVLGKICIDDIKILKHEIYHRLYDLEFEIIHDSLYKLSLKQRFDEAHEEPCEDDKYKAVWIHTDHELCTNYCDKRGCVNTLSSPADEKANVLISYYELLSKYE